MSRGHSPLQPDGTSAEFIFAGNTWRKLFGGEMRLNDSTTVKWSKTTRGIMAHVEISKQASGIRWHDIAKREYDHKISYSQNEMVVVSPNSDAVDPGFPKSPAQLQFEQSQLEPGDPQPEPNNKATPGVWVYVGTVPSITADPNGDTTKDVVQLPMWPLPDDSQKDPVTGLSLTPICWERISLGPIKYTDCEQGVEKTIYVNGAEIKKAAD